MTLDNRISRLSLGTLLILSALISLTIPMGKLVDRVDGVIISVGPSGDYTTIQEAIDNAGIGDRIVIENGTYTEQIKVDKQVTIEGKSNISTKIIGGFIITASNVTISNLNITEGFVWKHDPSGKNGDSKAGIISHVGFLTLNKNLIKNIRSGDGKSYYPDFGDGGNGGSTYGFYLSGSNNSIYNNKIYSVFGGEGGRAGTMSFGGNGGSSYGIYLNKTSSTEIHNNSMNSILAGHGGSPGGMASGGTGGKCYGIFGSSIKGTHIKDNRIDSLEGGHGGDTFLDDASAGKSGTGMGVYISSSSMVDISGNGISNVKGARAGEAYEDTSYDGEMGAGVYLSSCEKSVVLGNWIAHVYGGDGANVDRNRAGGSGAESFGILADFGNNITVIINEISNIQGGNGGQGGIMGRNGGKGGTGYGISIKDITYINISTNEITQIRGGKGGNARDYWGGVGGRAIGINSNRLGYLWMNDNQVSYIIGGPAGKDLYLSSVGVAGGDAFGFTIIESSRSRCGMNAISDVIAGTGGPSSLIAGDGGAGSGIFSDTNTMFDIKATRVFNITGGMGGDGYSDSKGGNGGGGYGLQIKSNSYCVFNDNSVVAVYPGINGSGQASGIGGSIGPVFGVHLSSSSWNRFFNNYFNTSNNVYDDGYNIWNISKKYHRNIVKGPYCGGNYWSNYSGNDIDNDGLGDTLIPYNNSGGIVHGGDHKPLMIDYINPTFGKDYSNISGTTGDLFKFGIDVFDDKGVSDVYVEYWYGSSDHYIDELEGDGYFTSEIILPSDSLDSLQYFFSAVDLFENQAHTDLKTVTIIDNDPPTFWKDSTSFSEDRNELTFSIEVSDNIELASVSVEYWIGTDEPHTNITLERMSTSTYNHSMEVPNTADDLFYRFHSVDISENWASTDIRVIDMVDMIKPFLFVRVPFEATTGDPFIFSIEASDNLGIEKITVEYWFNGSTKQKGSPEQVSGIYYYDGIWNLTIRIPDNASSMMYYEVTVEDLDGNSNIHSGSVDVSDNDPPEILEDLSDGTGYTGDMFTFRMDVRDNIGLGQCAVEYWSSPDQQVNENMVMDEQPFANVRISNHYTGPLNYRFIIADTSGNENVTMVLQVNVLDNDDPEIRNLTPSSQQGFTGGYLSFNFEVLDNVGVSMVRCEHWFGETPPIDSIPTFDGIRYHLVVGIPLDRVDPLGLRISASDNSSNIVVLGPMTFIVLDDVLPGIENIADATIHVGDHLRLEVKASDNIGIDRVIWDNSPLDTNGLVMEGTAESVGEHLIVVHVFDFQGNSNSTSFTLRILEREEDIDDDDTPAPSRQYSLIIAMIVFLLFILIIAAALFIIKRARKEKGRTTVEGDRSSKTKVTVIEDEDYIVVKTKKKRIERNRGVRVISPSSRPSQSQFCPICLGAIKPGSRTEECPTCSHVFHDSCARRVGNCPICGINNDIR